MRQKEVLEISVTLNDISVSCSSEIIPILRIARHIKNIFNVSGRRFTINIHYCAVFSICFSLPFFFLNEQH
jgi:hypothetical protein